MFAPVACLTALGVVLLWGWTIRCRRLAPRESRAAIATTLCGGGHATRVQQLLPHLQARFRSVECIGAGRNDRTPDTGMTFDVEYVGLTWRYLDDNSVSLLHSILRNAWWRWPVDSLRFALRIRARRYALVIVEFEPVAAWGCLLNNLLSVLWPLEFRFVPVIYYGHHVSFQSSRVSRPRGRSFREWCLFRLSDAAFWLVIPPYPGARRIGFHFENGGESWIHLPPVSPVVRRQTIRNEGHITVYFPAMRDVDWLTAELQQCPARQFEFFTRAVRAPQQRGNVRLLPVSAEGFAASLAQGAGLFTSAGFQSPAEALYLGKPVFAVPQVRQYEQLLNAAGLEAAGETVFYGSLREAMPAFREWALAPRRAPVTILRPAGHATTDDQVAELLGSSLSDLSLLEVAA